MGMMVWVFRRAGYIQVWKEWLLTLLEEMDLYHIMPEFQAFCVKS